MFSGKIELYDLSLDVGEENDFAERRPELVRKAATLMEKMHRPDPNWPVRGKAAPR